MAMFLGAGRADTGNACGVYPTLDEERVRMAFIYLLHNNLDL